MTCDRLCLQELGEMKGGTVVPRFVDTWLSQRATILGIWPHWCSDMAEGGAQCRGMAWAASPKKAMSPSRRNHGISLEDVQLQRWTILNLTHRYYCQRNPSKLSEKKGVLTWPHNHASHHHRDLSRLMRSNMGTEILGDDCHEAIWRCGLILD